MPKVSILIPIYNVEEYLAECLESVIHQTLKDIEIICINDGSTDSCPSILDTYARADSRITIINKENSGYGASMNLGLEKATGEYIGIVEPDDFVALNMFEVLYEKARQNDLDFIKADFYCFKENSFGDIELVYNKLSKKECDYNTVFNPSAEPRTLRFKMHTWTGIYKRDFIMEHGIRHNESPGASFQDNGFWFQTFIYAKRAMIVDKPFYMYRSDNPNSSVNDPKKVFCINEEYDFIRQILQRDADIWERFRGMYWYRKYDTYIHRLDKIADEYKLDFLKRFAEEFEAGMFAQEVDKNVFREPEWDNIERIIRNPAAFLDRFESHRAPTWGANREAELEKELRDIKRSYPYRLGKSLTYFPRMVRDHIRSL